MVEKTNPTATLQTLVKSHPKSIDFVITLNGLSVEKNAEKAQTGVTGVHILLQSLYNIFLRTNSGAAYIIHRPNITFWLNNNEEIVNSNRLNAFLSCIIFFVFLIVP